MGLDNPLHIAVLVVILLLLFGARRLPEIGRSLGTGLREFKQSINGESHPQEQQQQPTLPAPAPPTQQAPEQQAQASQAQEAFAQREPAASDRR